MATRFNPRVSIRDNNRKSDLLNTWLIEKGEIHDLRLNYKICPYCQNENKENTLMLNTNDYYECPECYSVYDLIYNPGDPVNGIYIIGKRGAGKYKTIQDDTSDLFKNLYMMIRKENSYYLVTDIKEIHELYEKGEYPKEHILIE